MNNVKTYKDGSRLVIVVENCTGPLAAKVNAFILDVLGMPEGEPLKEEVLTQVVPGIVPEKPVKEEIPDVSEAEQIHPGDEDPFNAPIPEELARSLAVDGPSGTLGRALDTGDTAAVVKLSMQSRNMDESVRYTALKLCKQYILKDCQRRTPECTPTNEIMKFFDVYKPLIGAAIKDILAKAGMSSLKDFFALQDEYQHQDAYGAILECIIRRVKE